MERFTSMMILKSITPNDSFFLYLKTIVTKTIFMNISGCGIVFVDRFKINLPKNCKLVGQDFHKVQYKHGGQILLYK